MMGEIHIFEKLDVTKNVTAMQFKNTRISKFNPYLHSMSDVCPCLKKKVRTKDFLKIWAISQLNLVFYDKGSLSLDLENAYEDKENNLLI